MHSLSMSDIGFDGGGSGVYSAKCEVFSALSLLANLDENVDAMGGNSGVTDMPELSLRFELAVIAPFTTNLLDTADPFELPEVNGNSGRRSGIMGTHSGYDFLFPSLPSERKTSEEFEDDGQDEEKPSNRASSQCFESFAYWPQEWQAPFGEIIHDTYEHTTAFGNYMALLEADPVECAASANVFGSSGVCREHSFGMPIPKTNTHSLCTSSTSYDESNTEETDIFECNSAFDDQCACSEDGEVNVGGGMGDSLGHLWPLMKKFLNSDEAREGVTDLLPNYTLNSSFMQSVSIGFLSMFMDLHAKNDVHVDTPIDEIVRDQCYGSERYTADSTQNIRCNSNTEVGSVGTELCCQDNSDCQIYDAGLVCSVQGLCVEMLIEVENTLDKSIEMGLNSLGCSKKNQDAFSGASPWRRMNSMMEQHGMCSHSNRVSHERMDNVFENYSEKQGVCSSGFDELTQKSFWVCNRSAVNCTWVRERPDFRPDDRNPLCHINSRDMRDKHSSGSVLDEGSFDMEPHLCDSDYMHSHTFRWCGLQHNDITENSMRSSKQGKNSRWMRTAPLHSQFSMLRPSWDDASVRLRADSGLQESERAPWNKMRFMGMRHSMLQYKKNQAKVLQNIAIQQCASLGLCQTEVFTSAGVHQQPRRKPMAGIAIPENSTVPVALSRNNSMKVVDMVECGPMGYIQTKHLQVSTGVERCVLDRGVAIILYLIKTQAAEGDGACQNLFGAPAFSTHGLVEENNGDLSYECANHDIVRRIQVYMNGFVLLESVEKSSRSPLLVMSPDSRRLQDISTKIHKCASDLHDFIEQQQQLYPNKKASGLHVMFDFGTYKIPMFWWMKFALSKRVFMTRDASSTAISVQALNGDLPLPLNSFTH